MNCPKCGTQNPEDVQVCTSCGSELTQPPEATETVQVKTSIFAITAFVFAILTLFLLPFALPLRGNPIVGIWFIAAILAIVLGIIALIRIGLSAGKTAGLGFAITGIIVAGVPVLLVYLLAVFARPRSIAFKGVCGSNLSGIGRAMLIYANDYDNELPRAGYVGTQWGSQVLNWAAPDRAAAFGLKRDRTSGPATISSSLYLLVKYAEVTPKLFICKGEPTKVAFKASDYIANFDDEDAWDFGPEPTKHYSYSYHMPYGPYFLSTASSDPNQAVVADRNPWLDPYTDTTGFKWNDQTKTGPPEDIKGYQKGNCGHHQREGQNVLFMDNHVTFEKRAFCGVNEDNIYTYWNGSDIRQGAPPVIGSRPADKLDSLLVNEPPTEDQK
jgi:hypothetical protein